MLQVGLRLAIWLTPQKGQRLYHQRGALGQPISGALPISMYSTSQLQGSQEQEHEAAPSGVAALAAPSYGSCEFR